MRLKYAVDKKTYYLSVILRVDSEELKTQAGISMNIASRDVMELFYEKSQAVPRDICAHLKIIYNTEKLSEKGFVKCTKTLHFMFQEILFHLDIYIIAECIRKNINYNGNIEIVKKMFEKTREFIKTRLSDHGKIADIGSNITKDVDGVFINIGYLGRFGQYYTIVNQELNKLGKMVIVNYEPTGDLWYECNYKGKPRKINRGRGKKF